MFKANKGAACLHNLDLVKVVEMYTFSAVLNELTVSRDLNVQLHVCIYEHGRQVSSFKTALTNDTFPLRWNCAGTPRTCNDCIMLRRVRNCRRYILSTDDSWILLDNPPCSVIYEQTECTTVHLYKRL